MQVKRHPNIPSKEFSRQVSTAEGEQFAKRMSSIFIEASAKTAFNVNEAFQEVVEKILDTPELWQKTGASGQHSTGNGQGGMPGGVQVVGVDAVAAGDQGGCNC